MNELSQPILASLDSLEDKRREMTKAAESTFMAGNGAMFPLDQIIFGVIKKTLSTTHAIDVLIRNWNLTSARAILRSLLETTFRFAGFWLVENPHDVATKFLAGKELKSFKSRDGKPLSDNYLAKELSKQFPWTHAVYKQTCDYVHFGQMPYYQAIGSVHDDGTFTMSMTETDKSLPDQSWIEVAECASECLSIIKFYLNGYEKTKNKG